MWCLINVVSKARRGLDLKNCQSVTEIKIINHTNCKYTFFYNVFLIFCISISKAELKFRWAKLTIMPLQIENMASHMFAGQTVAFMLLVGHSLLKRIFLTQVLFDSGYFHLRTRLSRLLLHNSSSPHEHDLCIILEHWLIGNEMKFAKFLLSLVNPFSDSAEPSHK